MEIKNDEPEKDFLSAIVQNLRKSEEKMKNLRPLVKLWYGTEDISYKVFFFKQEF